MFVSYDDLSQRIVSHCVDQLARTLSVFQGIYKYSLYLPIPVRCIVQWLVESHSVSNCFVCFVDENEIQEPNYASINCISTIEVIIMLMILSISMLTLACISKVF